MNSTNRSKYMSAGECTLQTNEELFAYKRSASYFNHNNIIYAQYSSTMYLIALKITRVTEIRASPFGWGNVRYPISPMLNFAHTGGDVRNPIFVCMQFMDRLYIQVSKCKPAITCNHNTISWHSETKHVHENRLVPVVRHYNSVFFSTVKNFCYVQHYNKGRDKEAKRDTDNARVIIPWFWQHSTRQSRSAFVSSQSL